MKIFYSELSVNPAYYSFGYSVYGQVEEGEELSPLYEQGFLPFVGAKKQGPRMMYLARGSRVEVQEFKEGHYHRYAREKCARALGPLEVLVREAKEVLQEDEKEIIDFFLRYFSHRFGKESMGRERISAILASPLLTHVVRYSRGQKTLAYSLETHGKDFYHIWYLAYEPAHTKSCLGLCIFIDFVNRAKQEGKVYAYLGVTCGTWMRYKTHFAPLQFFDGTTWVDDKKSLRLKRLLKTDAFRALTLTDSWREAREPYYTAPYAYDEEKTEFRLLTLISEVFPRTWFFGTLFVFGCLILLAVLLV